MDPALASVPAVLQSVSTDFQGRLSEASAASEAAVTAGAPPPPTAPTQQFLQDKIRGGEWGVKAA